MDEQLSPRGRQILEAIIEDYIVTAEPVGSRTITRRHPMSLSPATVRNVMSDLEEMGFLASPHTSAGRIPTDKAYRFYVNSLLSVRNIGRDEQEEILRRCSVTGKDMAEVLKETSRMLSSTSHYMVLSLPRALMPTFSVRSSSSSWGAGAYWRSSFLRTARCRTASSKRTRIYRLMTWLRCPTI